MYARVAMAPAGDFHFHRGPEYAAARLGYDQHERAQLPTSVTAAFAGVGNPHAIGQIEPDAVVLDIGCGAGIDLLLAARRIGPNGRAINMMEPGWENTLTGLPKEMYSFWDRHLRPIGYKIRVQVVDFSGGVPGDIALTLKWG